MPQVWILNVKHVLHQINIVQGKRLRIVEENADGSNPVDKETITVPSIPGFIAGSLDIGVQGQITVDPAALTNAQKAAVIGSVLIDRIDKVEQPSVIP